VQFSPVNEPSMAADDAFSVPLNSPRQAGSPNVYDMTNCIVVEAPGVASVAVQLAGTSVNSFCVMRADPVTDSPDWTSCSVKLPGFSDGKENVPCHVPVKSGVGAVGAPLPHAPRPSRTAVHESRFRIFMHRWDRTPRILSRCPCVV